MDAFFHFDSLFTAFQRVKENRGGPGADGVGISQFERHLDENLSQLQNEIQQKTYRPLPLLKILVDKGKGTGEARALSIPAVCDRVAQTAVLQYVEPVLEKGFEDCSFAYRRGRSVKITVQCIREWAHGISATAEFIHKKPFEGKEKIDMVRVAVRKIGNSYGSIGIAPLNP